MRVRCEQGLGNRVAAMANGLSRAEEIRFDWVVNEHVPVEWWRIFPEGIPGVRFGEPDGEMRTAWDGLTCERWGAAFDRDRANAAYLRIMRAMSGDAREPCPVAVAGRFFRNPRADARRLAMVAASVVPAGGRVFVFADSRRDEICDVLEALHVDPYLPLAAQLTEDLRRDETDLLHYLSDWKTLLAARVIAAIDGPSSALHPARAAKTRIIYASCTASA